MLVTALSLAALAPAQSAAHTTVESVPGTILDFDSAKVLYRSGSVLKIRDRATDVDVTLPAPGEIRWADSHLSPHGAIFAIEDGDPALGFQHRLYEWRDGALLDLGLCVCALAVRGDYAVWSDFGQQNIRRRDLATGTTIVVSSSADRRNGNNNIDVGANGAVAYWAYPSPSGAAGDPLQIFMYRPNGTTEQVTNDTSMSNAYTLTDGTNVAFMHVTIFYTDAGSVEAHYPGTGVVPLDSYRANRRPDPYRDYRIANGRVAYTRPGPSGELRVWRHSPTGPDDQVSPGAASARLLAINDPGEVMTSNTSGTYLTPVGGSPLQIAGLALGPDLDPNDPNFPRYADWVDGAWHVPLGGDLIRIDAGEETADVSLSATHSPEPVRLNDEVTWTFQIQNQGPSTANAVTLTDTFRPSHYTYTSGSSARGACSFTDAFNDTTRITCPIGALAPGESVTATVRAMANYAGSNPGFHDNTARVSALEVDPDLADNTRITRPAVVHPPYPRPKAATPFYAPLVIAYEPCLGSGVNRVHADTLSYPSCNPPITYARYLTVGTFDSNQRQVKMDGHLRARVVNGNPSTPADEADVALDFLINDVRNRSDLSDYTGELRAETGIRITDKNNTPNAPSTPPDATAQDLTLSFVVPCTANPTADGSDCVLATSIDALHPGAVVEGKRAIWQLEQIKVYEGGEDGDAHTPHGDSLFAVQGVFVP